MPFRAIVSPKLSKPGRLPQRDSKTIISIDLNSTDSFSNKLKDNIYSRPRKRALISRRVFEAPPSHSHGTRFKALVHKRLEDIAADDSSFSTVSSPDLDGLDRDNEACAIISNESSAPQLLASVPPPLLPLPPVPSTVGIATIIVPNLCTPVEFLVTIALPASIANHPVRSKSEEQEQSAQKESNLPRLTRSRETLLTFWNFNEVVFDLAEKSGYKSIHDIDNCGIVKDGNGRVAAKFQSRAQYGRFLPQATEEIFNLVGLKKGDTFLDIGSGIGLVVLQAAATRGCKSRGLELMKGRMEMANKLHKGLNSSIHKVDPSVDAEKIQDLIDLRRGDLTDPANLEFLTSVDVVFVNNYECIFSARSGGGTKKASLDDHIAALFTKMPVGCQCVTLEPLYVLGKSRSEANTSRKKRGLEPRDDSSFFEYRQLFSTLNPDEIVSWGSAGGKKFAYHLYTRVGSPGSKASFLCPNDDCETHKTGSLIPAIDESLSGNGIGLMRDTCPVCEQNKERSVRRGRGLKKRFEWSCKGEVPVD
eukprot:CAMPEP_0194293152 /NCGR_PEP_ID=MMETSP0169-20130528/47278_1 /TAXON_ID=218684 /ORGANISM="Corethron pennatum, Strain L29A3" /LENGTH=532 /DNA_ID=CAMNT_0039041567 /DNA_START=155 /DNA_END=1753 /DNA_ORIENTATION=+